MDFCAGSRFAEDFCDDFGRGGVFGVVGVDIAKMVRAVG